ncbi:hypothetical protein DFAR_390008 [Desulfarculales bacterium]
MGIIEPFKKNYEEACRNIFVYNLDGDHLLVSNPNEFLHPD